MVVLVLLATPITHSYYEKDVTNPLVFHSRGAYPWRSKIVILGEEAKRRMLNMDRLHTIEDVKEIMEKFIKKLRRFKIILSKFVAFR